MSVIVESVARALGVPKDRAAALIGELVESIRSETAGGEPVQLAGLGIFRNVGGNLRFEPESRLAAVVNHRFAGLSPIPVDALGAHAHASEKLVTSDPTADQHAVDEPVTESEPEVSDWLGSVGGIPVAVGAFDEPDTDTPEEAVSDFFAAVAADHEERPADTEAGDAFAGPDAVDALDPSDTITDDEDEAAPTESVGQVPVSDPWYADHEQERFSSYDEEQDPSDDTDPSLVPEDDVLFGSVAAADPAEPSADEIESPGLEEEAAEAEEATAAGAVAAGDEAAGVLPVDTGEAAESAEGAVAAATDTTPALPKVVKVKSRRSGIYAVVIVALLIAIAGVLYLLSRGDGGLNAGQSEGPASQPEETVDTTTPEDLVPETTPPPPEWSPGGIDRAADGYTIVTSSHASRAEAEAYARELALAFADTDLPIDVLRGTASGKRWYRVAIGQYPRQSVSTRELRRLSGRLPEGSWILRIRRNM